MKHLFKQLFGSFILLTFVFDLTAQVNNKADLQITQPHPRILLFKGEEANLVSSITKDPVWSMLHNAIIKESDRIITVAPIQRIQIGRRLLDKSREALKRLFYLSYAYRTTNDQKYLVRAENEMLVIAGFSDWNPSHFLDVAEMTMAMSIGYDWFLINFLKTPKMLYKMRLSKKELSHRLIVKIIVG